MRYLLLLLFCLTLFSDDLSLVVTENDPSSLVEGVSVITGDLYIFDEDYVVQGAEPIRLRQSFISSEGVFKGYKHLIAQFFIGNCIFVREHNGTTLTYLADPQNKIYPHVGKYFYGEKKRRLRYNANDFTQTAKGISNTTTGNISAQTNLQNQYIIFDPKVDRKGKSFTLHAADGTQRKYVNFEGQKKSDTYPHKGLYLNYNYKLVTETLPNGHIIHYRWDNKNRLTSIYTTNPNGNKKFAEVAIPVSSQSNLTLTGSDQRSITYISKETDIQNLSVPFELISPDLPNLTYSWDLKQRKFRYEERKMPYMQVCSLPKGRTITIVYSDQENSQERQKKIDAHLSHVRQQIEELKAKVKKKPAKYKNRLDSLKAEEKRILKHGIENEGIYEGYHVRTLSAPVGTDSTPLITHSFHFDKQNKNSYVLDAQKNKTAYFWNDDFRLTQIDRYNENQSFHNRDTFLWEGMQLRCKTFHDHTGAPLFTRVLHYDNFGNVRTDIFYGNLSGKSCPLTIASNGFPIHNGVEQFIKNKTYTDDGRNLLSKEEIPSTGYTATYTYLKDCHLPETKTICDGRIPKSKTTYTYNGDLILIEEAVDDGVSKLVKTITPYDEGPFIGMPQRIEEKYDNQLLKATVLYYGPGATIEKNEIYDATGVLRYTLYMTYDAKGRLTSETNAIEQKALYAYDEVGNKKYEKDFSGRLETFYEYDFSNRLIKKEEKGTDGIHRIFKYGYDTKHNLISETDPYGNETRYILDAFGNRKEIHLPPITGVDGSLVYPVIYQKFDSAGNLIEKTDAEGNLKATKYNAYGKPTLITHPDGALEQFTYFLDGNLETHTDASNMTTTYTYDYLGRIQTKQISAALETYHYEGMVLKKRVDAEGNETVYTYDRAGRKKSETFSGETTFYHYDSLGRLQKTEKGDLITIREYDLLDRVVEEQNVSPTQEVLRKVNYEYDAAGNRNAIIRNINGKEAKEEYLYDSTRRLVEKKDALGFIETWDYHPQINQKTHTDPMGLQTIETYNSWNQLASIEKTKNHHTLFYQKKLYNQNGQPILQIDTIYSPNEPPKDIQTHWEYNTRGQIKTLTEAVGSLQAKITQYTYTPRSELETVTKPNGVILTYKYNDYGHLESLSSSDGSVNHTMQYNLLGHLQQSDQLTRQTDSLGRIISETFPNGFSLNNSYDSQGRRKTCEIPKADCLIDYTYDPIHLKIVTRKKLDETPLYSHTYLEHDLSGNILAEERIDGQPTSYEFDPLNRKFVISSFPTGQKVIQFDGVGNILRMYKGAIGFIDYTYDDLYQLTLEKGQFNHEYAYDSLNNRLQKDQETFQPNALNQIESHFTYDQNGNPTHFNNTICTYDALDRLLQLETPNFTQIFTYDSLHRCLSKTTIQKSKRTTLYFLYDGQNEIGAFNENDLLELRILGNTPHAEIGAAIAIELNHKIHVPLHDLQGNLTVLKPLDSIPTFYHYTAFGEEVICGEAISPWRFSSKRTDSQTHLVNFGRRYYSPSFGRWLTPDPAGFTDGPNLYAYVHNSPLTHFDEYGLIMTGKDYKTVQQITSAPWEGERPLNQLSYYGRNLFSSLSHDLYLNIWTPIQKEFSTYRQYIPQFNNQPIWDESAGHQRIDNLFGTNCIHDHSPPLLQVGIPFGPSVFPSAMKISATARGLFTKPGTYHQRIQTIRIPQKNSLSAIWTSTKKKTSIQNAYRHWKNHGSEFPKLQNSKQYVETAKTFTQSPPLGTLMKTRPNGDIVFYNPTSNTFAISSSQGIPRTMYKPDPLIHNYPTNLEYFYGQ